MIKFNYEVVYILSNTVVEPEAVKKKILNLLNIVEFKLESLGEKKFAYPIAKEKSGHYYVLRFHLEPKKIVDFKDKLKWIPGVLRFLVVNLEREKKFRYSKIKMNRANNKRLRKEQKSFVINEHERIEKKSNMIIENIKADKIKTKIG